MPDATMPTYRRVNVSDQAVILVNNDDAADVKVRLTLSAADLLALDEGKGNALVAQLADHVRHGLTMDAHVQAWFRRTEVPSESFVRWMRGLSVPQRAALERLRVLRSSEQGARRDQYALVGVDAAGLVVLQEPGAHGALMQYSVLPSGAHVHVREPLRRIAEVVGADA